MAVREVEIVVTNIVVGSYEARSYPDQQMDNNGFYNLYRVPVYKILVTGTAVSNSKKSFEFMAPRFMPYFNDPKHTDPHYLAIGWKNAGLTKARTITVSQYKQNYAVQNRYSPGRGAIVVKDAFYIHAGPSSLKDVGFGSAGCIEIIGNYDTFKQSIAELSGISSVSSDGAIQQLVDAKKLIVIVQAADAPNIKTAVTRKISD